MIASLGAIISAVVMKVARNRALFERALMKDNLIELIVAGIALSRCDLSLVQSSLLGGLLSNLLLVLGMAFAAGGFRFHQQEFQPIVAQLNLSLMTLSVIALLVPAAFHELLDERINVAEEGSILLLMSRGTSVILLLM